MLTKFELTMKYLILTVVGVMSLLLLLAMIGAIIESDTGVSITIAIPLFICALIIGSTKKKLKHHKEYMELKRREEAGETISQLDIHRLTNRK